MYKFTKEGLVNNSANGKNCPVSCILCGNARPRALCADDSAAAHIQCYMSAVADQVARLCLTVADASSAAGHSSGAVRQGIAEMGIYAHNKSRTVCAVCQARTAPYIWVADKLRSIIDYVAAGCARRTDCRRAARTAGTACR